VGASENVSKSTRLKFETGLVPGTTFSQNQ